MTTLGESAPDVLTALAAHYSRSPAGPTDAEESSFQSILAAILGRAIAPRKVASALEALREAGLLDPSALAEADARSVGETLNQAGAALAPKALGPLLRLARWIVERHGGSAESLRDVATGQLREELLDLNGIGPPSADAILLFGLGRPTFPVDRASYRIAARHGWLDPWSEYDEARSVLERLAPDDAVSLAQLSGWLEQLGRDACRPGAPRCDRCPLQPFLPEGGARAAE